MLLTTVHRLDPTQAHSGLYNVVRLMRTCLRVGPPSPDTLQRQLEDALVLHPQSLASKEVLKTLERALAMVKDDPGDDDLDKVFALLYEAQRLMFN